jgi:ketosteroid isomerase-like protein
MDENELVLRLQRVEARLDIGQLAARYCVAIDDRDLDKVAALFSKDASFRSHDGVMDARGRDAIIQQFHGRYSVLGPTNHVTHDHIIQMDPNDPDRATGLVSAHAELWRKGQMMVTALRYEDAYVREDGVWKFADRLLGFLYYVPLSEYQNILGEADRMRAYNAPTTADYPEKLPSWRAFFGT